MSRCNMTIPCYNECIIYWSSQSRVKMVAAINSVTVESTAMIETISTAVTVCTSNPKTVNEESRVSKPKQIS